MSRQATFTAAFMALGVLVLLIEFTVAGSIEQAKGTSLPRVDHVSIVLVPGADWAGGRGSFSGENAGLNSVANPGMLAIGPDTAALGSVVTGSVTDVTRAAEAGSRDSNAVGIEDGAGLAAVSVTVAPSADHHPPPQGTAVITAGITTTTDKAALRPIAVTGVNLSGTLTSGSTRRSGLVDLTDLAPTALQMTGRPIPSSMTGSPMRLLPDHADTNALADADRSARFYDGIRPTVIVVYVVFQVFAYLLALALSRRGKELPHAGKVAGIVAAVPLAAYLVRLGAGDHLTSGGAWSALMALTVGMIVVMSGIGSRSAAGDLSRILAATIALMVVDLLVGAPLQVSGIFGSSPLLGTRYNGLGNPASALLLTATVLWGALHMRQSAGQSPARTMESHVRAMESHVRAMESHVRAMESHVRAMELCRVAAVVAIVCLAIGLPGLGSDVGGLFAFTISAALLLVGLGFGRIPWQWIAGAIASGVSLLVIVAALDYARPPESRTHLGRLVARTLHDGASPLFDTIGRKVDANVLGYGFPWSMGVLVLVGFMLYMLATGQWSRTLPERSPARVGVMVALVGSLLSYAVNDSGIVVVALVAVFLGPFILVEHRLMRFATLKLEVSHS